jgi:hypothetical protein
MVMVSMNFGQIVLVALAFTFAVGISHGVRRRRAQLRIKDKKK